MEFGFPGPGFSARLSCPTDESRMTAVPEPRSWEVGLYDEKFLFFAFIVMGPFINYVRPFSCKFQIIIFLGG
jgi:hypothetical protein